MTPSSILDRIPIEVFMAVYNKHLPNAWEKFTFRFFSTSTTPKDKWLTKFVIWPILIVLFLIAFIGTIAGASSSLVGGVSIPFAILLGMIGILTLSTKIMNNARINRICKELGITYQDYLFLYNVYVD
jgi:hypothetical protein